MKGHGLFFISPLFLIWVSRWEAVAWKPAAFNPFAISLVRQTLRCWPPAHRDDQPVLALADIMRDQKLEQIGGSCSENSCLLKAHHIIMHRCIRTGERAHLRNIEWIRNEAHIKTSLHPAASHA